MHFEFWLPRERYGPFQAQAQALGWPLRQPQPREVEPQPAETPVVPEAIPARMVSLTPGEVGTAGAGSGRKQVRPVSLTTPPTTTTVDPCGPCPDSRGRAHRLLHYCGSDFGETPDLLAPSTDPNEP